MLVMPLTEFDELEPRSDAAVHVRRDRVQAGRHMHRIARLGVDEVRLAAAELPVGMQLAQVEGAALAKHASGAPEDRREMLDMLQPQVADDEIDRRVARREGSRAG